MINNLPSLADYATHDESRFPELWEGCVGAWAPCLGPTGLRLHDFSRVGNWGTLTNMDAATDWVVSGGRYALDFDGSNDYVVLSANPYLITNRPQSCSIWVNMRSIVAANNPTLFSFGQSGTPFISQFYLGWNLLGIGPSNGTTALTVGGFPGLPGPAYGAYTSALFGSRTNEWLHIYAGWSGVTWRIFVNGVEDTITQGNTAPTTTTTGLAFVVGATGSGTSRFINGTIAEVMYYHRFLPPAEIRTLASDRGVAYQRRRRKSYFAEQLVTFRAAWARNSNYIISPVGAA